MSAEPVWQLLLAARGNPDYGQDPNRPPFGVPDEYLVQREVQASPEAVARSFAVQVRAFCERYGLGDGNWVGGDIWKDGQHLGRISFNGRFFAGEQAPLVRDGEFAYGKSQPLSAPMPAESTATTEGWRDVLLSAIEASSDEDWADVFALRPDLADRLRSVLDHLAPGDVADDVPSTPAP